MFSPYIDQLITRLRVLPGVGPKSASRMALYLLQRNREGALALARALQNAAEKVGLCQTCRTLTEERECSLCKNPRRQASLLCVVESPQDILAIEQAGAFSGQYFVLHGHLSPIDGIGPKELGMDRLEARLAREVQGARELQEVILATNPTMEGEATAHFIAEKARAFGVRVTRIAHGVPMGGELEYIDGGTLAHAMTSRREL